METVYEILLLNFAHHVFMILIKELFHYFNNADSYLHRIYGRCVRYYDSLCQSSIQIVKPEFRTVLSTELKFERTDRILFTEYMMRTENEIFFYLT